MASNQETGHAVNISNFKLVIDHATAQGLAYNPANTKIQVPNMTIKWNAAKTAHDTLTLAVQTAKVPINEREIMFKPLGKMTTRIVRLLKSTEASSEIKKDVKGLADKIRGFKVKVKTLPDGTPDPNDVSNSHLSFVQKADTFKQLADLLSAEPLYVTNIAELESSALQTLAADLKTLNDDIGTIIAPVNTQRIARNEELYDLTDGIVTRGEAAKDYVMGAAGYDSEIAKTFRRIKFRKRST
jgi:ribosome-binding ATPase YchF (GTP1/OBG family)